MVKRGRAMVVAAVAGLAALSSPVLAAPTMDAIDFPIDIASVGTALAAAGAAILLIVFALWIGFKLVKRLVVRATNAV